MSTRFLSARPVERTLSISSPEQATPFGCCTFFDNCTTDILSLYYRNGLDLLDWMGFNPTDECYRSVEFINYLRPEQSGGADTAGYISNPCSDPNGVEFGSCKLSVEDFGLYGREGPTRKLLKPERYCKTTPRRLFDGTPIESEFDWDMTFTMDQLLNDIRSHLVVGNATTSGQFDGLQRWVRTGLVSGCQAVDPYVVNWNNNPLGGGAGITVNGAAAPAGYSLVDFLLDIHRNNKERISWSPVLRGQTMQLGDTILVMPGFAARCLLDEFTCWSVCPGEQYEVVLKDYMGARDFRLSLNGGLFGDGQISLDGDTIPILQYDWELINGPTRFDMYMLTGAVGNVRIWEGEHLSAQIALDELMQGNTTGADQGFWGVNGNRVLGRTDTENLCRTLKLWMSPRLWCMAPWLQTRIQNVACHRPIGPLSPNPSDTSFYPQTSFEQATC